VSYFLVGVGNSVVFVFWLVFIFVWFFVFGAIVSWFLWWIKLGCCGFVVVLFLVCFFVVLG